MAKNAYKENPMEWHVIREQRESKLPDGRSIKYNEYNQHSLKKGSAMTFVYDAKTHSAYDKEREFYVTANPVVGSNDPEYRDDVSLVLKSGRLQCAFNVVSINIPSARGYKPAYAKDYMPSQENNAKAGSYRTFILEDTLHKGFAVGLQQIESPSPEEADYERIKTFLKEYFLIAMTKGGELIRDLPGKTYEVAFEKDLATVAAKNPGKLKKYEQWASAYKRDGSVNTI